jgi:drug/metabolite transporter (DMT)-like permease
MWALFALGAAFLTSFNPILYKRMLKSTNATVVVWSVTLLSLPLLALFTFALTRQLPGLDALFALGVLGSAVLNVAAHLASTRSLKLADASLVTPLLVFSPVFTLLISAVFLGEIPSARGLLGVGLVLVGAYWLNHEPGRGWLAPLKVLALKPGVTLVLLAGLLWAITPLFEKTAIQHTRPESPQFAAFVATALLVLLLTPIVTMRNGSGLRQLALHRREALLAGLIAGIALHGLQPGPGRLRDDAVQAEHRHDRSLGRPDPQGAGAATTPAQFTGDDCRRHPYGDVTPCPPCQFPTTAG